jgi:hypothetical protein
MFPVVDVSDTTMAASGTTKKISVNNILSSSPTASGALTVTGLVTAGSATITGDLTVDTSTLKVDSTNNRVGINTATPSYPLHVVGTGYISSVLTLGGASRLSAEGSNALNLNTNSADRITIDSAGNVGVVSGNVVMSTSGKGIDFSATAGTGTSELLADYEEGTWTPTVTSTIGTLTTTTLNSANYTKIGRLVSLNFDIAIPAPGTGAGYLKVTTPFSMEGAQTCGVGRELINTGNLCQAFRFDATTLYIAFYNDLTAIALNNRVACSYIFTV